MYITFLMFSTTSASSQLEPGMIWWHLCIMDYRRSLYDISIGLLGGKRLKTVYQNCPKLVSILSFLVRRINRAQYSEKIGARMTNLTSSNDPKLTQTLLTCGIAAGPLYVGLGLLQVAIAQ